MKQFLKLGRTQSSDRSAREPEGSAVRADYKIGYVINPMLLLFEELSGLKVNFHKSMLTGVNISASWLSKTAVLMNCRRGIIPFFLFGVAYWRGFSETFFFETCDWSHCLPSVVVEP